MNIEKKEEYKINKRRFLRQTSKYQSKINFLTILPAFFFCLLISLSTLFFHKELIHASVTGVAPSAAIIQKWNAYMLVTLWTYFVFILIWSQRVSSDLVGAFERVIKELDAIISGDAKHLIHARERDDLANELLKRINTIIVNLPSAEE